MFTAVQQQNSDVVHLASPMLLACKEAQTGYEELELRNYTDWFGTQW